VVMMATTTIAQPGFLLAMVPEPGAPNHLYPWSIDPVSGNTKQLQDDYIMAAVTNTANGGSFNPVAGKAQFIGQSLTRSVNGPVPNPTMNFLVGIDAAGEYTSTRLVSWTGGVVYSARITEDGKVYGMEQSISGEQDARLDTINDDGLCETIVNTTAKNGYNVGHVAIDSAGKRFFVSVKNTTGATSLQTIDLTSAKISSVVDLPNAGSTRITMCWDIVTASLYSMERLSGSSDTTIFRVNPLNGQSVSIATISGRATIADCRRGSLWAIGTKGSDVFLATVDLTAGKVSSRSIKVSPAPVVLIFFPQ